ncbi:4-hydroxy-tetrahydrodipicolinate reductase [Jeotgalicoccus coquinae]|uniref:4-hydroxy-tetrahydrodipicolinate reductase n=1 Tax=Jeotgalicoccus coquinae TaxID=709509 RepID=A0A6V7R7V4_9STAP|nr:4-hydroxy-tetrahydrodipicolinate reductase [Jeotgalicoccus coquinae]MBB6423004.1 4-hydroxy-tetrahydrodipicolinate reductase [Jeotgalicoccus coquinae]GGE11465.1 4-hydroxy-tetrahydrodipicolinate reductase [Jeotgalicoccus coquinae]CAD2073529.1 4-hydroxy-tetrahydrodipicolinate reductase [Jeotgalicoccus coquinae]
MRILLIGYGTMNKIVARLATEAGHEIAGVISSGETDYPAFDNIDDANADVAIDFSNPERILPIIEQNFKTPLVVATTGQKDEIVTKLNERAESAPVFFSANMSYGVHVLNNLLKEALNQLADYDLELVERHHNRKVDAPSGTLVKLLDTALESRDGSYPVYDRSKANHQRSTDEIGVSAIRGGTIVGEHEAIFAGLDEVIELKHIAQSKDIFANGAIKAAESLINKGNGFYDYNNIF